VVDVVDSHKAIDGIGIVVVQPLQVTRSERASIGLAVSHGDSPSGSLEIGPGLCGGLSDGCCVTPQLLLVRRAGSRRLAIFFRKISLNYYQC
jgi:hypothetical protein